MAASFFRVVYITVVHPPYVPFGPAASRDNANGREKGVGAGEYNLGNYRNDIDAPGLEQFYSKDIFVCEQDGKPIWCSHCGNVRRRTPSLQVLEAAR
jgi:palmitoyltransferase